MTWRYRLFNYRHATGPQRCETCYYMRGDGTCPVVGGPVERPMVCGWWRAK